ncbi:helix-turn-helix domain-containing protein [Catellatospora chokoriensis]|uniref:Integrase/transposase n=1 Tax=Catellatospora chokoriensis TaxID=310353 RepID=A0A8J3NW71_9ACTN|nr:integrase/transposase [Catellatospora chokoriensis]
MSEAGVRVGVGTLFRFDGETVEVVELVATAAGNEVVGKTATGQLLRLSVRELLFSGRAQLIPRRPGPAADDDIDSAAVVLAQLTDAERHLVAQRAGDVREVLTGFRSGSAQLAGPDEPRPQYALTLTLRERYSAKAAELGVTFRTIQRWVRRFQQYGEAGLAPSRGGVARSRTRVDERWVEMALEVMVEHTDESRPSRLLVIERTKARLAARYGDGAVRLPSQASAYRLLEDLERRHPTFRLSAKRNRDVAARPKDVYGKLRPTRPGEYMLMDTTRLDVFALDPLTLRWMQAELTVAMDWYTRCVTGVRVTPVSTKSVDASVTLYQAFRPPLASSGWPQHAVWPEHGIPATVLVDRDAVEGPLRAAAGPAVVPETIVIDHGNIYISEHLTSVCQRLGISIQPARLRTGRDKGPIERFFRTLREDLLQVLPGYKGPDVHSRGLNPERDAFFFLDELEAIIREWVAVVYHHRPHAGLRDPGVPGLALSPAKMFEHGIAKAGYVMAPRDPDLGFEFLQTEWRTIQHYGVEIGGRRYNGRALNSYRDRSSSATGRKRGKWPFAVNVDDITRIYFRDPEDRAWTELVWEHAADAAMPLSEEGLAFARELAASKYTYPNDKLAVAELLDRWNVGLGHTREERRIALRIARSQSGLHLPVAPDPVKSLASVRHVLEPDAADAEPPTGGHTQLGDDDLDTDFDDDEFYSDALGDV